MPDADKSDFISGEKVLLKRMYKLFHSTRSHGIVSMQFLVALNLFFGKKQEISKDALTKVYHNLSLQALSNNENIELKFESLTKLATEIKLHLQNLIFANKSGMQKLKFNNEKNLREI